MVEPEYKSLKEAELRIADLTNYATHVMEYNNFYDTLLVIRDYHETKIFGDRNLLNPKGITYATFDSYLQYEQKVIQAPTPKIQWEPLPKSEYTDPITTSQELSRNLRLVTRDNHLSERSTLPMSEHTFLPGSRSRPAVSILWKQLFQPGEDNSSIKKKT